MRRYLADTNILLFSILDEEKLSKDVKYILNDYDNEMYISSESIRELMNLLQAGKISVEGLKSAEDVIDFIKNKTRFVIKYVKEEHFRTFAKLPWFNDHMDHRDRMIIAHAITEKLDLISSDTQFYRYKGYGFDLVHN